MIGIICLKTADASNLGTITRSPGEIEGFLYSRNHFVLPFSATVLLMTAALLSTTMLLLLSRLWKLLVVRLSERDVAVPDVAEAVAEVLVRAESPPELSVVVREAETESVVRGAGIVIVTGELRRDAAVETAKEAREVNAERVGDTILLTGADLHLIYVVLSSPLEKWSEPSFQQFR